MVAACQTMEGSFRCENTLIILVSLPAEYSVFGRNRSLLSSLSDPEHFELNEPNPNP